jgi:hypothetical protein
LKEGVLTVDVGKELGCVGQGVVFVELGFMVAGFHEVANRPHDVDWIANHLEIAIVKL